MNPVPAAAHGPALLVYTVLAVLLLVVLIARFKVNSVVSLVLASLFIGLAARMDPGQLLRAFREGVGNVLGSIALIIAFGNMLGKMLAESGGAERIANTLVDRLGESRVHWAMMGIACIVGVPVFFQVGVVLLIPLLFLLARQTRTPILFIGVPLLAGLSVMHGLVPPHPGPMAAIGLLKADVGRTIFYSLIVGLPTVVIAGPLLAPLIVRRVPFEPRGAVAAQFTEKAGQPNLPAFSVTVFTVLLPVLLMLLATGVDLFMPATSGVRRTLDFIGDPIPAMLIAVLVSFYTLGFARGFTRTEILKFSEDCLAPIAGVLLIIGSGGGFSRVLSTSGVGDAVAALATGSQVPPLLLGWLIAALIRLATGSATVAITTAAGILAPMVASMQGLNIELMVLAMGAGSLIFSHLNDSGFWFVKEYFGMSVGQTLRTWSVIETVISVVAIVFILALNAVV
jgi:gluconate:H+ symporter, GntP family